MKHLFKVPLVQYFLTVFVGSFFLAASEELNPDALFLFDTILNWGPWSYILGISLFTVGFARYHGFKEGKRIIPRNRKIIRVVYRAIIIAAHVALITFDISLGSVLFYFSQLCLFGAFFDPSRNLSAGDHFFYHGNTTFIYDQIAKKAPVLVFALELAAWLVISLILAF